MEHMVWEIQVTGIQFLKPVQWPVHGDYTPFQGDFTSTQWASNPGICPAVVHPCHNCREDSHPIDAAPSLGTSFKD